MKVLGIMGSPRKRGNTEILLREVLTSARMHGAETEMLRVSEMDIRPCDGCESCVVTGKCRIKDDMQNVNIKLLESDGIIIGSPVYFWGVTAQVKAILDRTYMFRRGRALRNKVGGAVIVARTTGISSTVSSLRDFFNLQNMIPASSIGTRTPEELAKERNGIAIGYADKKGDISKDERAMAQARALGLASVETINLLRKF